EPELAGGVDGVYLVLHGAMACETVRDVEGDVLRRIRSVPELATVPVCGVYDLHGNISPQTAELSDGVVAYRNNPHTDSRDSAIRAANLLDRMLTTGKRPVCVWEQPPVMWPPTGTGTADEPMRALETAAREIEEGHPDIAVVNVFAGFSFADTPHTGVSFSAVTFGDPELARGELRRLSEWAVEHRRQGNVVDPPLNEVLPKIRELAANGEGPIVIVEPADNIGGGAPGDATTVLKALIAHEIDGSAVAINDPAAVSRAAQTGIGATVRVSVGGKGSRLTDGPLELDVELLSRSDGRFDLEDRNSHLASMGGVHIDMGPCAVVRHRGVRILLTSRKTPPFDLGQLRSQGIEPESCSVIGVKAAVAHRRAYDGIANHSYTVSTPGPCSSDLTTFPWRHIRRGVFPLDGG
ncbi:MAG: M81 family metallopeptidase, partial [Planctomycetaceae bacterium]